MDSNTLNTIIWIVQILAGVMFLMAGIMKSTQPRLKIAEKMGWANDFTDTQVKLIGISEVLGGIGLVLPALTGILPVLTPIAAVCLGIIMVGAAYTHFRRNETIMMNVVLLALCVVVAYGRFVLVPLG